MPTIELFDCEDYKAFLRAKIDENRGQRAYQTRLAEAAGCQKSFFSQVLHSGVHLTPEHAAGLCRSWAFTPEETDYFVDLVQMNRAGTRALRAVFAARLEKARRAQRTPSDRFKWPGMGTGPDGDVYYSSWYWSAIHIIVGIPRFRTADAIATRLGLPPATVAHALAWLEAHGLVRQARNGGWEIAEERLYLPDASPMVETHHFNWRHRAIADLQRQNRESTHYSAVFSIGRADLERLRQQLVSQIEAMTRLIGPSPAEELACFTCDLFKL